MNDVEAATQAVQGLALIVGVFSAVPAGIVAGISGLAAAAGWFFGDRRRKVKSVTEEESQ